MTWQTDNMRQNVRAFFLISLVAIAVGLIVLGFANARTGNTEKPLIFNINVVQLVPPPNSIILRQSQVGVNLKEGFEGRLAIDGRDIPDDQVYAKPTATQDGSGSVGNVNAGTNQQRNNLLFTPGVNTEFERFSPGEHCIVAIFWRTIDGPDVNPQRQEWCFKAA